MAFHARSSGATSGCSEALTIQSRGTIIVPILVPLSQALGPRLTSLRIILVSAIVGCSTAAAGCATSPAMAKHDGQAQVLCWLKGDADLCSASESAEDEATCGRAHMRSSSRFEQCMTDLGWRPVLIYPAPSTNE